MAGPDHLVHLQKSEYADTGGDAADESGFMEPLDYGEDAPAVQGFFIQAPGSSSPDKKVWVSRDALGNMTFYDDVDKTERTLSDLLSGAGGGISEAQHDALDDLTHWLAETNYMEVVRTAGKVTGVINWTDSGKTTKIREMVIARSAGKVSQMDFIQYDGSGVEKQRMTGVITRTAGKVSSVQWTETGS